MAASFVPPQLCTKAAKPPTGQGWVHEIKFDGYRMLALVDSSGTRFLSRNKLDWTDRFRGRGAAVSKLGQRDLILDGEIVVYDREGRSDFGLMQQALSEGGGTFHYVAFDLLRVNGKDYRAYTLIERKERLHDVVRSTTGLVRYSEHLEGEGAAVFRQACRMGLEGIISKRADAPYRSGRTESWIKVKCLGREEFVIGGYMTSERGRAFASLLVGEMKKGKLEFRGGVGTGYSESTLAMLRARMDLMQRRTSPFVTVPREYLKGARWVQPRLVAEIKFGNVTRAGILRHSSFVAPREDKSPTDA